jgi:hypothetical protein
MQIVASVVSCLYEGGPAGRRGGGAGHDQGGKLSSPAGRVQATAALRSGLGQDAGRYLFLARVDRGPATSGNMAPAGVVGRGSMPFHLRWPDRTMAAARAISFRSSPTAHPRGLTAAAGCGKLPLHRAQPSSRELEFAEQAALLSVHGFRREMSALWLARWVQRPLEPVAFFRQAGAQVIEATAKTEKEEPRWDLDTDF